MKKLFPVSAVIVIALTAAACGSSSSPSSTPTPSTGGGTSTPTTPSGVAQGGTLKLIDSDPLDQWDGQGYYGKQWQMEFLTMNCLVDYNPVPGPDSTTLIPGLATDLGTASADGKSWKYTLRQGIVYSDGTPVQAADVKAYMERVLDPGMGTDGALGSGYYGGIVGMDKYSPGGATAPGAPGIVGIVVSGNDITFNLTAADPDFPSKLSLRFICPQKPGGPHKRNNTPEPSTGPYMMTSITDKSASWVRNPHWADNAKAMGLDKYTGTLWNVDQIDLTLGIASDAQILQLKNNEADMSWNATAVDSLATRKSVENDASLASRFIAGPDPFVRYVALNEAKPPFDNVAVRQAANYAVDRSAIIKIAGAGTPWSQILGAALVGKDGEQPFPATPDGAKAKELLASSGVKDLTVVLQHGTSGSSPQQAAALKAELEAVGFKVKLLPKPPAGYYSLAAKGESNMYMAGWAPDWPDASGTFGPLLLTSSIGGQNLARNKDSAFDAQVATIQAMPYGADRNKAWNDLSASYSKSQVPWIVTRNGEELNLNSDRLQGFAYDVVHLVNMAALYLKK